MTIDEIDLRILDMLQRNGKLSQAKIAGAVGLTTPSVNERIKKMERHGMIKGFVALLDHEKMGFPLTAYVDVALEHPRFEKGFIDDLEKLLAVQECHYVAGEYAYRLKVKAADPATLADFIQRRLLGLKGVSRVRTEVSLASKKESTLLPLVSETDDKTAGRREPA
jgi:Lrp/AsnC family leucine-responsive transcriptional regulator